MIIYLTLLFQNACVRNPCKNKGPVKPVLQTEDTVAYVLQGSEDITAKNVRFDNARRTQRFTLILVGFVLNKAFGSVRYNPGLVRALFTNRRQPNSLHNFKQFINRG